jgi:hypothetical protein
MGHGRILIRPTLACIEKCKLVVNGKSIATQKAFESGEPPVIALPISSKTDSIIEWTLSDGNRSISGRFLLTPFSDDAFAKALEEGKPSEILGD